MAIVQTLMNSRKHIDEVDLEINISKNVALRPLLEKLRFLEGGVEANLYRMLYAHGPGTVQPFSCLLTRKAPSTARGMNSCGKEMTLTLRR